MYAEELFAATRRRLFVPVKLYISGGVTLDIRHPDSILVTRRSVMVALPVKPDTVPERALSIEFANDVSLRPPVP